MSKHIPVSSPKLYLVLDTATMTLRIGSCEHCVVGETGRPERAWDNEGDRELDFDRDELAEGLRKLGIEVEVVQEFVCP